MEAETGCPDKKMPRVRMLALYFLFISMFVASLMSSIKEQGELYLLSVLDLLSTVSGLMMYAGV